MTGRTGLAILLGAATALACGADRQRPGPPILTLTLPDGRVATSPDTISITVRAHDDNGLDSVVVAVLDDVRSLPAFNEFDVFDVLVFAVPGGLAAGDTLVVRGYARDLVGERTFVNDTLTIVAGATR